MINWITNNLGTSSCKNIFDVDIIIKKSYINRNIYIIDIRDLVDKSGNSVDSIKQKIDDAIEHINKGQNVVVCCDYGISRSNAIASGILSKIENIPFNDAVRKVIETTGANIKIDVLNAVRKAIDDSNDISSEYNNLINKIEKRILVTGGNGFIASHLVPELRKKYDVYISSHKCERFSANRDIDLLNDTIELDILIKELKINHIIHLANPRIYTDNKAMGDTIVMLKNVAEVCIRNNVKLIFPSGWEVYSGYDSEYLRVSEYAPRYPKGPYGEAKYLCEMLLEQYKSLYDLKYTIIRSGPIYGGKSDRPKFIHNFIQKATNNETIVTHHYINGYPYLDLLHISDLIPIFFSIIDNDYIGSINIGSGIGISTNDIAQLIVKLLNSNSEIRHQEIDDYTPNIIMNNTLVKKLFGWDSKIRIEDGIEKLINDNYGR